MTERGSLAYPGAVTGKHRINFDNLSYNNPEKIVYVEFNPSWYRNAQIVAELPVNSLIYGDVSCRILEVFDAIIPELNMGTMEDEDSIGWVDINELGVRTFHTNAQYGHVFTEKTRIVITLVSNENAITAGNGWLVFRYLELNSVSSFRQIKGIE
jgi:hypothetical protein